jgi:hypothetical protein
VKDKASHPDWLSPLLALPSIRLKSKMSLHDACRIGDTLAAIALIERGASVNEKDQIGWTPLHAACRSGRSVTAIELLENGALGLNDRDTFGDTSSCYACLKCTADVILLMIRQGVILTAADLQSFRERSAVTEEQACIVETAYKREDNWRRRAHYVMFLSSIRDLVDVEHEPGPSALTPLGEGGGMGRRTRAATQAKLMRAADKVLCRTNTQRLIASFL